MTRKQNSSSADLSILTACLGEEWTARINDGSRNYIRKNAEATFPFTQLHPSGGDTEVDKVDVFPCSNIIKHFGQNVEKL